MENLLYKYTMCACKSQASYSLTYLIYYWNWLCKLGVLSFCNDSEWGAPCFIQTNKNNTIRFLTHFRELNKRIKRKIYPIPNIQYMLLKLEGFWFTTSLDLNMGYYHIQLTPNALRICAIVLPCGKYEYFLLPMGVSVVPDIFQEKNKWSIP